MFWPVRWLLSRLAIRQARRMRARFHGLTQRPAEVQRANLFEKLRREERTGFGRDHHFAEIRTVADFRRHLPITRYEYYQPYIERVQRGELEAMFDRQKVLMFAMTSGTTASRKYIPVTRRFLDDYRRGWTIWGLHMFEDHRELWFKPMLQLASDWDEHRSPANIPCGSISGLTVSMQKYVVRRTYLLPPPSARIRDVAVKYYLAWRLGLVRPIGLVISANPSTMVQLARFGEEHADQLIRDVADGAITVDHAIPEAIWKTEARRLAPNPQRARQLDEIRARTGRFRPKDVWPDLGLVGNWTGGSVGAYLRHYPEYYGEPAIRDIGLIASEGRMTIPIADGTPAGILEITSSYFEFIPVDEIDSAQPTVLESHELREGEDYYILLTTSSGLYRYDIHDVVRCVGWHEKTPLLSFLNKGAHFSNLTGEKISEYQVARSVEEALARLDLRVTAFTLAPCWDDHEPYYGLFVEWSDFPRRQDAGAFATEVEARLAQANSEYQAKRTSRRLGPVRIQFLEPGAWKAWDQERLLRTGGVAEQYKHPCLVPDTGFGEQMARFRTPPESASSVEPA